MLLAANMFGYLTLQDVNFESKNANVPYYMRGYPRKFEYKCQTCQQIYKVIKTYLFRWWNYRVGQIN